MEREAPSWTLESVIEPKSIDITMVIITKTTYRRRNCSLMGCGFLSEQKSANPLQRMYTCFCYNKGHPIAQY